jgi:hypothetical protein
MPPKGSGPSKKTVEKIKDKLIEDKTFGLKVCVAWPAGGGVRRRAVVSATVASRRMRGCLTASCVGVWALYLRRTRRNPNRFRSLWQQ